MTKSTTNSLDDVPYYIIGCVVPRSWVIENINDIFNITDEEYILIKLTWS